MVLNFNMSDLVQVPERGYASIGAILHLQAVIEREDKSHSDVTWDSDAIVKLPRYIPDIGFFGTEPIYETIALRLADKLGFPHVDFDFCKVIVEDKETYGFVEYNGSLEEQDLATVLDDCPHLSVRDYIASEGMNTDLSRLFVLDFVTRNRRRYLSDVILTSDGSNFAPLRNYSYCLLSGESPFSKSHKTVEMYHLMNRIDVCELGSLDLRDNIRHFMPATPKVNCLTREDILGIARDLPLSDEDLTRVVTIIWNRYNYLVNGGYVDVK